MSVRRAGGGLAAGLALLLLGGCGDEVAADGVADDPASPSVSPPSTPSVTASSSGERTVAVYYVGDGEHGPLLFREVLAVDEPDHGPAEAIGGLSSPPRDPDYRTAWPAGAFLGGGVNVDDGTIDLLLADDSLRDRPPSLTAAEAQASIQQVVYTLQDYAGRSLPVRFLLGDRPADRLLGVPLSQPVAATSVLTTLSLMSVTTPVEGQVVSGSFVASGLNNGFEGTAAWQILDHGRVVAADSADGGNGEDRLYPWQDRVDVSGLAPGTYTFLASNDDPTIDDDGPDTDTRTIVVE